MYQLRLLLIVIMACVLRTLGIPQPLVKVLQDTIVGLQQNHMSRQDAIGVLEVIQPDITDDGVSKRMVRIIDTLGQDAATDTVVHELTLVRNELVSNVCPGPVRYVRMRHQ
jgi:hypothetical protein